MKLPTRALAIVAVASLVFSFILVDIHPFMAPELAEASVLFDAPIGGEVEYIVNETEPNDLENDADPVPTPSSGNSTYYRFNKTAHDDTEWFEMDLKGGGDPTDLLTLKVLSLDSPDNNFMLILWIYYIGPIATETHILFSEYWSYNGVVGNMNTVYFVPPTNSTYLFRVSALTNQGSWANITFNITINSSAPPDLNNNIENLEKLDGVRYQKTLDVNEDAFDWYYVEAPRPEFGTRLNMTVFINESFNGTDGYGVQYACRLTIYVYAEYTPGFWTHFKTWRMAENSSIHQTNDPYNSGIKSNSLVFEHTKNVTRYALGFCVDIYGYWTTQPTSAIIGDSDYINREMNYSITGFKTEYLMPNYAPVLRNGSLSNTTGRTTDYYNYTVIVSDYNNVTPAEVLLWWDNTNQVPMEPVGPGPYDYVAGVTYFANLSGTVLDEGDHTYNFSASDGGKMAVGDTSIHFGPNIDDNFGPVILNTSTNVSLQEDFDEAWVQLAPFFDDPNGDDLEIYILDQLDAPTVAYFGDTFEAYIVNNGTVGNPDHYIRLKSIKDAFGEEALTIQASDTKLEVELDFNIKVNPVNDAPVIKKINGKSASSIVTVTVNEDSINDIELTIEDPDSPNCGILLPQDIINGTYWEQYLGSSYPLTSSELDIKVFNVSKIINVRMGDPFVGSWRINITVSDGDGLNDTAAIMLVVKNTPDKPELSAPANLSTPQNQELVFQVVATDPDPDETLLITSNLELVLGVEEGDLWSMEQTGGVATVRFKPMGQAYVGDYNFIFKVHDASDLNSSASTLVTVEDINDPPEGGTLSSSSDGLLATFTLTGVTDADMDPLSMNWNFGDGYGNKGSSLTQTQHTYAANGTYNVTVNVTDGQGGYHIVETQVTVTAKASGGGGGGNNNGGGGTNNNNTNNTNNGTGPNGTINQTDPEDPKGTNWVPIIVVIVAVVILLVLIVVVFLVISRKKDDGTEEDQPDAEPEDLMEEEYPDDMPMEDEFDDGLPMPSEAGMDDDLPMPTEVSPDDQILEDQAKGKQFRADDEIDEDTSAELDHIFGDTLSEEFLEEEEKKKQDESMAEVLDDLFSDVD